MTRPEPSNRPSSLAAAATTLIALVALAATAQTSPACVAGVVTTEAVLASESKTVRAVAAAVAAVAREIFATGHTTSAGLPAPATPDLLASRRAPRLRALAGEHVPIEHRLAERLLDLPPPTA